MPEPWVNAVIELTIALDGLSVDASYTEKQDALSAAMDQFAPPHPNVVASGHWEDVCVEDDDVVPYKRKGETFARSSHEGLSHADD